MITDPAWFYSSLSQSAAALIGLMAALLLARLLQHLADVVDSRRRLIDTFRATRRLQSMVRSYAKWLDDRLRDFEVAQGKGEPLYVNGFHSFGSSGSGSVNPVTQEMIDGWRRDRPTCDEIVALFDPLVGLTDLRGIDQQMRIRAFLTLWGAKRHPAWGRPVYSSEA